MLACWPMTTKLCHLQVNSNVGGPHCLVAAFRALILNQFTKLQVCNKLELTKTEYVVKVNLFVSFNQD